MVSSDVPQCLPIILFYLVPDVWDSCELALPLFSCCTEEQVAMDFPLSFSVDGYEDEAFVAVFALQEIASVNVDFFECSLDGSLG